MEIGDLIDGAGRVVLWLSIAIIAAILLVGALVFFLKRENFKSFTKYATGIAVGYAVSVFVVMAYLTSLEIKADGVDMSMYGMLFYPVLATIVVIIAGAIAMLVASMFNAKATKIAGIVTALGALGGFIAIMVRMSDYYKLVAGDYPGANTTGLIVSAVVFMVLIAAAYALGDKRKISDTRSIVYGAISIAMAFALSYARFFKMPQGGSVTFASLLPLMIYCCMFGTRRGILVCLVYGTLQALQDPYIIHPMQFLLDYTLAFGTIGVSGLFVEKGLFKGNKSVFGFIIGGVIAVLLRYACHVCSGVFAFADYADLEKYSTALAYSFGYNSFTLIDMVITLAAGSVLFVSRAFMAQMSRSSDIGKGEPVEQVVLNDNDDEIDLAIIAAQNADEKIDE